MKPPKRLKYKPYVDQKESWPDKGKVILAQYDDDTIVVYQAFRPAIARWALDNGAFGGPGYKFDRMSWIKPGFLWMTYRSAWATAKDQTSILAIWLTRIGFDTILEKAVHSHFEAEHYQSRDAWQSALQDSEVRLQWDPDHSPNGMKLGRRAIQLGLGGETLRRFATEWIYFIEDITPFVREQARFREDEDMLFTPYERPYPLKDQALARRLGLSPH